MNIIALAIVAVIVIAGLIIGLRRRNKKSRKGTFIINPPDGMSGPN